jgi:hypothetical protein
MIDLATKHFFMFRIFELKLAQVLTGIQFAAQSDNPTVMIALTRSTVEHLAASPAVLRFTLAVQFKNEPEINRQ